jgi:hypothetical protein
VPSYGSEKAGFPKTGEGPPYNHRMGFQERAEGLGSLRLRRPVQVLEGVESERKPSVACHVTDTVTLLHEDWDWGILLTAPGFCFPGPRVWNAIRPSSACRFAGSEIGTVRTALPGRIRPLRNPPADGVSRVRFPIGGRLPEHH